MAEESNSFRIGEIVYVLSNKTQAIVPALVVEETTINTLKGKKVSWKVAIGPQGPKQKVIESSQLNGDMFPSLKAVEEFLKSRLTKFIDKVVGDAKKNEDSWYGHLKKDEAPSKSTPPPVPPEADEGIDPESLIGDFVNDSAPVNTFQENVKNFTESEQKNNLRESLVNQIAPSKHDLLQPVEIIPEEGTSVRNVRMPDGTLQEVDFKV